MTDYRFDDGRDEWNEREDDYGERTARRYFGRDDYSRDQRRYAENPRREPEPRRAPGRGFDPRRGYPTRNPYRVDPYRDAQYAAGPQRRGEYGDRAERGDASGGTPYFDESYGGAGRGRWNGADWGSEAERDGAHRWDAMERTRDWGSAYDRDDYGRRFSGDDYGRRFGGDDYGRRFGGDPQRGRAWNADSGQRFGQPPKGYKRSDERIREDVCDALMRRPDLDASDVDVQVRDGEVTLQGSVRTRTAKFSIEDLADTIPGVNDVTNSLRIMRQEATRNPAPGSSSPVVAGGSADDAPRIGGARSPNAVNGPRS